ncbi:sugar ABC transporter permease [Halococcus morrhuae DSM 1307]|uniref:Sugar ABC transporter permease n=2 Tax=Halococcus TaxID=2249 RepID=M0M9L2_HALMO|nr:MULTISPECIES: sugar ABC transporter permease [Halococcus]EMA41334.1 sugar ABC transporter permease [Halococcus morrhuae DSM 1307]UOO94327.1 sugar ABC transporter permease [Halococcus dombrowskii]
MATERSTEAERRSGVYASAVRWLENLSETAFAYLLLAPAFLLLAVIAFWPLLSTFRMSLFADSISGAAQLGEFVGLENYVNLLTGQLDTVALPQPFFDLSAPFQSALIVTFIFTIVSVFFETIIGLGQALVLDQKFRGRRWVRVAIIIPWAVPIVIQGMMFYLLFRSGIGPGVAVVEALGGSTSPLVNSAEALPIIILADVWKTTAFMALLILAGLQSVDRSLYDVAKVAGATKWQQFKTITFPLVLPTVLVAMLFRTIAAMRIYGLIETTASCTTVPSLSCLVVTTFSTRRYGTASAVAFVTAAIIGIVVSIYIVRYWQGSQGAA